MGNRYTVAHLTPEERAERRKANRRAGSKRYAVRHPELVKARYRQYHATKGAKPEARARAIARSKASYKARRETILAESAAKLAALSPEEYAQWRTYRRAIELRWKEKHREEERIRLVAYRQEHREALRLNSTKYRQKHPDKANAASAAWKKSHPEERRIHDATRRARTQGLPFRFSKSDRDVMMHYWHFACAVCGNQEGFQWTIVADHWIPIVSPDCPGTIPTNMVPLCHGVGGCNNSKQDKDPSLWLVERYGTRKAARIQKAIATYFATKVSIHIG